MKGNLSGTQIGPRPIEGTGFGVYGWGLRRGTASVLGCTPRHSRMKYVPLRVV